MQLRLQVKTLLIVVPLVVVPILLVGLSAQRELRSVSAERMVKELEVAVRNVGDRVTIEIANAQTDLELFSYSTVLKRFSVTEDEQVRYTIMLPSLLEEFRLYQKARPAYKELRFLRPDGFEDVRIARRGLINATEEEGDSDFFHGLRESSGAHHVSMFESADDGKLSVLVALALRLSDPVADPYGRQPSLRGYLAVTIDLGFLEEFVRETIVGQTGGLLLVDSEGKVLMSSGERRLRHWLTLQRNIDLHAMDEPDGLLRVADGLGSAHGWTKRVGSDLYLVGVLPRSDVDSAARQLTLVVTVVTVLAILGSCILIIFALQYLVLRPVRGLHRAAVRIGAGDLETPIHCAASDEVGLLARAFHDMAQRLLTTRLDLENRNRELEVSRDAAQVANVAKDQFLATMSHEIRTPINGVLGMSDLILRGPLSVEQKERAEMIRGSGVSLLRIVNDVLDFSKIEAGKLDFTSEEFTLGELVQESVEIYAEGAREKGVELSARLGALTHARYSGDSGRIRQVLGNLVGNALKFTERGSVIVTVERGLASGKLRFDVVDTGIGIPAVAQGQIFEAFTQVDGSTTRSFGGSGLGLAICKRLVGLMGGDIGVESEPATGSRFWFSLTLREVDDTQSQLAGSGGPAPGPGPGAALPEFDRLRVLLVEDNPINEMVAAQMLKVLGCTTSVARDGCEALEAMANEVYDLVLMDCQMPRMDGFEATRELRRRELSRAESRVPVVAVTANAMAEDRQRCLDSGMDDYLAKPFTLQELADTVHRVLGAAGPNTAIAASAVALYDATPICSSHVGVARNTG